MTAADMKDYLLKDLLVSVINDVGPCLNAGQQEGGYFGVPRLVLSYVDYLGTLYHGYDGSRNRWGRREISKSQYGKSFLTDIFGMVDPNYAKHGGLLWEIYRNGTVHLYQPLKFENAGKTIGWFVYKGGRSISVNRSILTHLVPHNVRANEWVQPISINCLYDDLQTAIQQYASKISSGNALEVNFRKTADALQIPEQTTTLIW